MNVSARNLVLGLAALLMLAGIGLYIARPAPMNLILITLDTTRPDRIGCYGYLHARTPELDALAKSGVLFERAYAPVPVTLPSHASIFTGLYPPEHGLRHNGRGRLGADVPVLAEALRNANYETGAFVASYVLDSKFGLDRGFQTYDDAPPEKKSFDHHFQQFRSGQSVVDAALNWLQRRDAKPFFCWVHLYDAHAPYQARSEAFGDEFLERPYDAGIAFADLQLQRLCEFLRTRRLVDRTVIVVVGDHGEGLMQHAEEEHGYQLYDTTLKVPLVIVDPRSQLAGTRVATAVSLVDIMPTILDCLMIPSKNSVTGQSLKTAMSGGQIEPRPIYAETDVPYLYSRWAPLQSVINERWKFIKTTRIELYDLHDDPQELHDLADSNPEQCRQFENLLNEMIERMRPRESTFVPLSKTERNILQSLGYVSGRGSQTLQPGKQLPDIKDMMPWFNRIGEAQHLLKDGDRAQGIEILREVVEKMPDYVAARMELGNELRRQRNYAEAASTYASVVALEPDFADAYASWADALADQGGFSEAFPRYLKALELDSQSAACHFSLANCLLKLGRTADAISELNAGVRLDPDDVEAHMQLGGLLAQSGLLKSAISEFEAALKRQPDLVIAHADLGSLFAQVGRFEKAMFHASKAVEIDPDRFEARYTLGAILMEQKRYRDAMQEFAEACRIRPDDQLARQQLQNAKAKAGVTTP
jgi:arylsulfatase A-like enzyme/tetratricopeptide (TPR) repeat protein